MCDLILIVGFSGRKKSWPFACEFEHLKLFKGYIDEDEERHKFGHKGGKAWSLFKPFLDNNEKFNWV